MVGRLRDLCSHFGVFQADGKVEAGEMDVEGRTTGPFDLNNNFLPVQSDQRAYSWVIFPCALQDKDEPR